MIIRGIYHPDITMTTCMISESIMRTNLEQCSKQQQQLFPFIMKLLNFHRRVL